MTKSIRYTYWAVEYKNKNYEYLGRSTNMENEDEAKKIYKQKCLEYDDVWLIQGSTIETVQSAKNFTI